MDRNKEGRKKERKKEKKEKKKKRRKEREAIERNTSKKAGRGIGKRRRRREK